MIASYPLVGLYSLMVLIFTLYDVWGFGYQVAVKKRPLWFYRVLQKLLEILIDGTLIFDGLYSVAICFEVCHFCFGCDWLYYFFRHEDYSGYTITWFQASIPSLVFRGIGKPFTGKSLQWIGPLAVFIPFVVLLFLKR